MDNPMTACAHHRHVVQAGDAIWLKFFDGDFVVRFDATVAPIVIQRFGLQIARDAVQLPAVLLLVVFPYLGGKPTVSLFVSVQAGQHSPFLACDFLFEVSFG